MTRLSSTGCVRPGSMTQRTTRRSWSSRRLAGAPRLWFQLVPESKVVKNRVHLDLACPDVRAGAARLTGLGARVLAERAGWVTMADPEGNEFDVTLE